VRLAVSRTAGVALEGAILDFRDRGINRRISLFADWFARRHVAIRTNATMEDFTGQDPIYSASILAAFRIDNLTLVSPSATVRGQVEQVAIDVARASGVGPGVSGRARVATGNRSEALAQLRADTPWLRAEVDGTWASDREADGQVGLVGSLVYIDQSLHMARPVGNGFALVRVPDLGGVRVMHNRMEVGKTDWRGAVIVPQLFPYNPTYLSVNPDDIPFDREMEKEGAHVAVPFGGAATRRFAEKRLQIVRGQLYIDEKTPVPAGGEVTVVGKPDLASPVGGDGRFEFMDLVPGSYRLGVQYAEGRCSAEVTVKDTGGEVDLGTVECKPASSPSPSP
jgi:outer membrane usher protein